jgi:SOS-response transcriptional repressor LexA
MDFNLLSKSVNCQATTKPDYTPDECTSASTNLSVELEGVSGLGIGEIIRIAREKAGLTQVEAATRAGFTQKSWSKIEVGAIKKPRHIDRIESILGLPKGYLNDQTAKQFAQPVMARCPLLKWGQATNWPENKDELVKSEKIKPFAGKVILGENSFMLRVENNLMNDDARVSFREGSFLLVDPDVQYQSGDYVVALFKDTSELFFRRYIKEAGKEYLVAGSGDIKPIVINDNVTIKGVIILNTNILKGEI